MKIFFRVMGFLFLAHCILGIVIGNAGNFPMLVLAVSSSVAFFFLSEYVKKS